MSIRLLAPEPVERIWGTKHLGPLFPDHEKNIGEIWFDAGPTFPLLIKFLFTADKLSVQVHPDDSYAGRVENSRGKTEMWHILSAEPGATIALGFEDEMTTDEVRRAIDDNTLEDKLKQIAVKPGETYLVEAGTVHAIGSGLILCEIQQNSNVTYRLYDYGRRPELHVEKGLAVANTGRYEGWREFPVICDRFRTDLLDLDRPGDYLIARESVLIALEGSGTIGDTAIRAGQVAFLTAEEQSVRIEPEKRLKLLHATGPAGS